MTIIESHSLVNILGGRNVVELQAEDGDFHASLEGDIKKWREKENPRPITSLVGILRGRNVVELQAEDDNT